MATHDKEVEGKFSLSRRDFLKAGTAAAVAGAVGVDFAGRPSRADAAPVPVANTYHTTCPYCSASCGQLVDVDAAGNVLDVYGDFKSPFNDGGLCAKGAGAFQLVTNPRRLGVEEHTAVVDGFDFTGRAWKRLGDGAWQEDSLDNIMAELAPKLVAARGAVNADNGYNSRGVAFFGSSHLNDEPNIAYRRLIAQFGTSNVEHQARI